MAEHKRFIKVQGPEAEMRLAWTIRNMQMNRELPGVDFRKSRNAADGDGVYVLEGPAASRKVINQLVETFDKSEEQGNA